MKLISKEGNIQIVLGFAVLALFLVVASFLLPWNRVSWGRIQMSQPEVVTVSGEARTTQKNQVSSYTAGVNVVNDNKDNAVKEVNQKVTAIIEAVKNSGIPDADIKTQNLSIYQNEEMYWEDGRQKSRPGQWRVSNSVEVKLKDMDQSSALADLLTNSGANNVYGPNFTFDDTNEIEKTLFDQAMKDAREKAELIAKASGRSLGKVMSVSEGGSSSSGFPMMRDGAGGGGGAPIEPGSGTVSKNLTVSFELR